MRLTLQLTAAALIEPAVPRVVCHIDAVSTPQLLYESAQFAGHIVNDSRPRRHCYFKTSLPLSPLQMFFVDSIKQPFLNLICWDYTLSNISYTKQHIGGILKKLIAESDFED